MQDTEIQELFARLTAQFEDCAALAAEGHQAGLSREEARELLREIRNIFDEAERCLARIEQCKDGWH